MEGPTAGRLSKPSAGARRVWQETTEAERRIRGTNLCSLLRNRGDATLHPARTEEYSQASADSCRLLQHQLGDEEDVGSREATRTGEPHGRARIRR